MAATAPKNSVWAAMNYTPPRGRCNHKTSLMSPACPCLRFMLHPIKVRSLPSQSPVHPILSDLRSLTFSRQHLVSNVTAVATTPAFIRLRTLPKMPCSRSGTSSKRRPRSSRHLQAPARSAKCLPSPPPETTCVLLISTVLQRPKRRRLLEPGAVVPGHCGRRRAPRGRADELSRCPQ